MPSELPTDYQLFIHRSRYARWSESIQRREIWPETVLRYIGFFTVHLNQNFNYQLTLSELDEAYDAITSLEVMPSMRCLMTAGPALKRDNICGYNCSYLPIDHPHSFDNLLYILMCGTGAGFSVESQYISKLPVVPALRPSPEVIRVADSKTGWAAAFRQLLEALWQGLVPTWDLSSVRPAGSPLRTMGGRASGPTPLHDLFSFAVRVFQNSSGRKLTSLECHDLCCKVGQCVVMGGVRRSALISLSNLSDASMRSAKADGWWKENPQRALANNSVAYDGRPTFDEFEAEWTALRESRSGERGIFNRDAARRQVARIGRRDSDYNFGTNPCAEIILRPRQFCNLSEVVARPSDTYETLARKVRIAATLGTWQSLLTDFRWIDPEFARNCREERLLGVSITGIMDCPILRKMDKETEEIYHELKQRAIVTNRNWADRLGIARSAAITCVKPSGTVSQLVDSSSGLHPRFAPFYIRRVRQDSSDPLTSFLIDRGFPYEADVLNPSATVFSFPVRSPVGAVVRDGLSATEHLALWEFVQRNWCEHKPSATISVRASEWADVHAWTWDHFSTLSGVAFLPYSDHNYQQAPYEAISKTQYLEMADQMPPLVDWESLRDYEREDYTTASQELACVGGSCEL